jgi:hypothetical protein
VNREEAIEQDVSEKWSISAKISVYFANRRQRKLESMGYLCLQIKFYNIAQELLDQPKSIHEGRWYILVILHPICDFNNYKVITVTRNFI